MKTNSKRFLLWAALTSIIFTAVIIALLTNNTKSKSISSNNTINDKCQVTATTEIKQDTKASIGITKETNDLPSLKGNVSYEPSNSTPKADSDAKILLIPANLNKDDIFFDDISLFSNGRDFDKFRSKYSFATKADSNGDYEFTKIPKGKYVIISVSNNLTLNPTPNKEGSMPKDKITHPLTPKQEALLNPLSTVLNKNLDELALLLFRSYKYDLDEIEINSDEPLILNLNFSDKN